MTFREAEEWVRTHCLVELKQAPFSQKDPALVEGASACTDCPKRTGNNRGEYPDGRADICTDPGCFRSKVEAHADRQRKAAAESGRPVLGVKETEDYFHGWGGRPYELQYDAPYIDLGEQCPWGKKGWGPTLGKSADDLVVVAVTPDGVTHRLVDQKKAHAILLDKGLVKKNQVNGFKGVDDESQYERNDAKRRAEEVIRAEVNRRTFAALLERIKVRSALILNVGPTVRSMLLLLLEHTASEVWHETMRAVLKRHGREVKNFDVNRKAIRGLAESLGSDSSALFSLWAELVLNKTFHGGNDGGWQKARPEILKEFQIDGAAIEKEVRAEKKAKASKKKAVPA